MLKTNVDLTEKHDFSKHIMPITNFTFFKNAINCFEKLFGSERYTLPEIIHIKGFYFKEKYVPYSGICERCGKQLFPWDDNLGLCPKCQEILERNNHQDSDTNSIFDKPMYISETRIFNL